MRVLHRELNSLLAGLGTGGAGDPVNDVVLLSGGKSFEIFEHAFASERGFQVRGDGDLERLSENGDVDFHPVANFDLGHFAGLRV